MIGEIITSVFDLNPGGILHELTGGYAGRYGFYLFIGDWAYFVFWYHLVMIAFVCWGILSPERSAAMMKRVLGILMIPELTREEPKAPVDSILNPGLIHDTHGALVIASGWVPYGSFHIRYRDACGEESIRWITPHYAHYRRGIKYFIAWCHLRQEERTFRHDRIIEIIDHCAGLPRT